MKEIYRLSSIVVLQVCASFKILLSETDFLFVVNTNNQSECILKTSGICNLLVKNVQNLISCVGSQLDSFNFSFKSSSKEHNKYI